MAAWLMGSRSGFVVVCGGGTGVLVVAQWWGGVRVRVVSRGCGDRVTVVAVAAVVRVVVVAVRVGW